MQLSPPQVLLFHKKTRFQIAQCLKSEKHTLSMVHCMFQAGTGCPPCPHPLPADRGARFWTEPSAVLQQVPLHSQPPVLRPVSDTLTCGTDRCTHTPPCPSDDADLVELKQELEAVGEFRHRSPSRSLSVPNRPRPPHPPQRPPPPSKTLLAFSSLDGCQE